MKNRQFIAFAICYFILSVGAMACIVYAKEVGELWNRIFG